MKQIFYSLLLLLICFSCKKKDEEPELQFTLKAELTDNIVELTWSDIALSGVKSVNIYRSSEPIPEPTPDKPINNGLLLTTITDKSITTYTDVDVEPGTNGSLYYRALIVLADRSIASNEEVVNTDGFSVDLSNLGFSGVSVIRFSEANLMYVIKPGSSSIDVVDYSQKKIVTSSNVSNLNNMFFCPVINQGSAELYIYSGSSVICYDARTLSFKFAIPVNYLGSVYDMKVNNGFLYLLSVYNSVTVRTYDINARAQVNQRTVQPYNSMSYYQGIYVGNVTNKLYYKYVEQYYNSQIGNYVYACRLKSYNLVNGIPNDSTIYNIPQINLDSLSNNSTSNISYIQVSPDGKYISCNNRGDVYSVMDGSMHNITSGNNSNPMAVFSSDGTYLMGKNVNGGGISFNISDVYTLPGFTYKTGVKNPAPSQNTFLNDAFLDRDSVISYSVQQNFQSNENKLIVFFKKID